MKREKGIESLYSQCQKIFFSSSGCYYLPRGSIRGDEGPNIGMLGV